MPGPGTDWKCLWRYCPAVQHNLLVHRLLRHLSQLPSWCSLFLKWCYHQRWRTLPGIMAKIQSNLHHILIVTVCVIHYPYQEAHIGFLHICLHRRGVFLTCKWSDVSMPRGHVVGTCGHWHFFLVSVIWPFSYCLWIWPRLTTSGFSPRALLGFHNYKF